jgi:hypothetical protein
VSGEFVRRVRLPVTAAAAFAWHERPGAFERLAPPWERVEVVERSGGIRDGAQVVLRAGPLRSPWRLEHRGYVAGARFEDVQIAGPFARWRHVHEFRDAGAGECELEDRILYALPGGRLGDAAAGAWVRRKLERTFDYRHRVLREDLAAHAAAGAGPLRVAVTGAGGLLGSALVAFLTSGGHETIRLVRRPAGPGEVRWDPERGVETPGALEGCDAVVHLAGEGIADARWSPERRRRIESSRVEGTRTLCAALSSLRRPPRVLVSASAVGYYGDRGDEILSEHAGPGTGFLADLVRRWEDEARAAERAGMRVVPVRTGLVLTPAGGVLGRLLPLFRAGIGGPLAGGRAWWSWIAIDDWVGLVHFALTRDGVAGPWNAVAPEPVTNADFTRALARAVRRPAVVPAPRFALELVYGEMSREAILASQRARPDAAIAAGYRFRCERLEEALDHLLGTGPPRSGSGES